MDSIKINDMRFFGYHGVLPEETKTGQYFRVNISMKLHTHLAGVTDDLGVSVSYADVFQVAKEIVEGDPCQLLEAVAEKMSEAILKKYSLIEEVIIEVIKEKPPIPGFDGTASVEISRKQLRNIAYLSLGANIGDREGYLRNAVDELELTPYVKVARISSLYETKPVGNTNQRNFLNQVIEINTSLKAIELLDVCQEIEFRNERNRVVEWGPRTLDIDILLFNNETINQEHLIVPHPRMTERAFCMIPLAEVAPDIIIPGTLSKVSELAEHLPDKVDVQVKF